MDDELVRAQLDQSSLVQCVADGAEVPEDKREQVLVAGVPGRHDEQPARTATEEMTVPEVPILRDDDPTLLVGETGDVLSVVLFPSGSSDVCTES